MNNKIHSLDFFRILGALLIFLCHIPLFYTGVGGGVTVELFIVLSGFVIGLGLDKPLPNFKTFMANRLNRLYPQYMIAILLGLLYMVVVAKYDLLTTLIKVPIFLLCLQTLTPFVSATGFDSSAWYVATLVIVDIMYWCIRRIRVCFVYKLFGGAIYCITVFCVLRPIAEVYHLQQWLYYFSPFSRVIDFAIGIIAAIVYKKYPMHDLSVIGATILEFICLMMLTIFILHEKWFSYTIEMGIPIALMFYVFSFQRGVFSRFFALPIFQSISEYSYSFYLIHYLVIMTIVKLFQIPYGLTYINVAIVMIMFVLSCILSMLLSKVKFNLINKVR